MTMAFGSKSKFEKPSKEPKTTEGAMTRPHQSGDNDEGAGGEDISHLDIHDVVNEHGAAKHVHIHHDESEGAHGEHDVGHTGEGRHHVHSIHGMEDHQVHHHSYHQDPMAAHEHGKVAAGLGHEGGPRHGGRGREEGMVAKGEKMDATIPGY